MKIKKLVSKIIVVVFLLSGLSAFGAGNSEPEQVTVLRPASYVGVVKEVLTKDSKVFAITIEEDNAQKSLRRFNISDRTVIIDNESGYAFGLSNIKADDKIGIIASSISTRSIPPQSPAYVIFANINKSTPANLMRIKEVTKNSDGSSTILDDSNNYMVTIVKETELLPYRTKQIVSVDSLSKDAFVLVWSDFMTMSIPAKMTAKRLVLLNGIDFYKTESNEDNTSASSQIIPLKDNVTLSVQTSVISVNGKEINDSITNNIVFYKNKKGSYMLPLRAVTEALGYKVTWVEKDNRVDLIKNKTNYSIYTDVAKQKNQNLTLSVVTEIKNGRTYVSEDFFKNVLKVDLIINSNSK